MLSGIIVRVRSLFSGARNANLDAEMQAEFEHHMALRAEDLVKSGVAPDEALRRARAEFGGAYNHKEAGREARGLRWFDAFRISWLDVKLGARMVHRYPGLTVVGALAMGVAIAIGAAFWASSRSSRTRRSRSTKASESSASRCGAPSRSTRSVTSPTIS